MDGSVEDPAAPDSWEMADLDETMTRLMISSSKKKLTPSSSSSDPDFPDLNRTASSGSPTLSSSASAPSLVGVEKSGRLSEEAINQVDQFLREALQNPRERLSILRMEQDVLKFIRDPMQQQLEFQQLPTSYLRLAAHRVAQHYFLQSMVILDNNLPDGSGSRIIVRKTSESRLSSVRLADIPINLPQEDSNSVVKLAKRPQKRSQNANGANHHSSNSSHSKSVEERKEEYNRARARIFSSNIGSGTEVKTEIEPSSQESLWHCSLVSSREEDKAVSEGIELNFGRSMVDSSTSSGRTGRGRTVEPVGRYRGTNRVAIFRDREIDQKDPDYDRNYDRYMQRFDPGFGFNGGSYSIQPLYAPAVNYNTEFPQLGSAHRPQMPLEHQPRPIPQHLRVPWPGASTPAGIGYGCPETMMGPFSPNHVGTHSSSTVYLHSPHYSGPRPGMPYLHPHEQFHQHFVQPHQQQPEATFGVARPR